MDLYHATNCGVATVGVWGVSQARGVPPIVSYVAGPEKVLAIRAPGSPASKEDTITCSRPAEATAMAWHPSQPLLAMGWSDGGLSLWDASHQRHLEEPKEHNAEITHVVWSSQGTRLASADNNAKVIIWAADNTGRWRPLATAEPPTVGAWVTHCVWDSAPSSSSHNRPAAVMFGTTSEDAPEMTTIRWLDEGGSSGAVFDLTEPLAALLPYPEREQLVAISALGTASVLTRPPPSVSAAPTRSSVGGGAAMWVCAVRMMLAKPTEDNLMEVSWAGPHTVAIAQHQELCVHLFDLDTQDNALLRLEAPSGGAKQGVSFLSWSEAHQQLAVATTAGHLQVFKRRAQVLAQAADEENAEDGSGSSQWQQQYSVQVGPGAMDLAWGPGPQHVAALCEDGIHLTSKQRLLHKLAAQTLVLQVTPQQLVVQQLDASGSLPDQLNLPTPPVGLDASTSILLVYSASTAQVYKLGSATGFPPELTAEFEVAAPGPASLLPVLAVCNETIFRAVGNSIEACNLAGTVKQTLALEPGQGVPVLLTATGDYLAVVTSSCLVRVFKASGREARPHAGPGPLIPDNQRSKLRVTSASLNANGTMLAGLTAAAKSSSGAGPLQDDGAADSRVWVYCSETNTCWCHDFAPEGRVPVALSWDVSDPRLLAVQVRAAEGAANSSRASSAASNTEGTSQPSKDPLQQQQHSSQPSKQQPLGFGNDDPGLQPGGGLEVALLFSSASQGLVLQEYQDCSKAGGQGLVGLSVPHLLLSRHRLGQREGTTSSSSSPALQVPLQGFAGLNNADPAVRGALLDFAYHLSMGRQEEAFRAVAALQSPAVWRTMAHAAIKSKRLDVAEHCLGNMEHVRGARALREAAASIPQLDARVGLVAVHLGLPEDAKRLFAAAGRWDLLAQLLAALGEWEAALEVAAKHDRLHLDALRYSYAQHLETCGEHTAALQQYTATAAGAAEVPRLLWRLGRLEELEAQVMRSSSPELMAWWARFCEASGSLQQALACYQRAGNHLAMVRVHCATGNWAAAEQLVASTGDPAAAFHLGRLYEAQEKVTDALRCYAASKRFAAGVRLAQRYGMTQEVLGLALQAPPAVQLEAADTLLGAGATAAAAQLYQAGGKPARALQLAAAAGRLDVLEGIAAQLGSAGDPAVVARCAEAFLSAGHYDKAASLLARVGQISRALDLLQQHDLPLSEELAEALTPPKEGPGGAAERQAVLLRLAQLAKAQGLWSLAAKKYTQAGDRLAAMKALVKARDTEKVVFFAGVSRQPEVYLLAANYLQTLEWRGSPELTKHIVSFYTKAGAPDSLARFYESCAELEVDQYKDYSKALQAYREASKQLSKAKPSPAVQEAAALVTLKADNCERLLTARASLERDPAAAVAICQGLLADAPTDAQVSTMGVDPGDIYGLLVEWCYGQGNAGQALQLLQQMAGRGLHPERYLEAPVLGAIYEATGAAAPVVQQRAGGLFGGAGQGAAGGEVEEELPYLGEELEP